MYDQSIVEKRIELAQQELGFKLEYHSPQDIDDFERRLAQRHEDSYMQAARAAQGATDPAQAFQVTLLRLLCNPTDPRLSVDEVRWMQNERALVMSDAAYYLTRYHWILNDEGIVQRFSFRSGQRIFFNVLAELERLQIAIEVLLAKARQLGMCLHPDTRVLTTDLRWLRIDDVKVGDRLVAVDEESTGRKDRRRMRETTVEAKRNVVDYVFTIRTEDGRVIKATAPHKFLVQRNGYNYTQWVQSSRLHVGDSLRRVVDVWAEPQYEDGWIGGLLDGEGSLRQKERAGSELCLAQVDGPVFQRAKSYLQSQGYKVREEWDTRKGGVSSKLGNKPVGKLVLGRIDEIMRLIGSTRPSRLLSKEWWQGKEPPGKSLGADGWTRIVSIELSTERQRMVDLQTGARTFIAEGVVSHNSTIAGGLLLPKIMWGHGVSAVTASADTDKTKEMVSKIFMAYDRLQWWLRPVSTKRSESEKGYLKFGQQNSGVIFQHGSQTNPIAMGTTIVGYHLSECSNYGNPEDLIETGLFKAVHPNPRILGVLESTCKGNTGWWHDSYWDAKSGWPRHESRLLALFLPFYCAEDMYPNETERRAHPIPHNWHPQPETLQMIEESEAYVQSNPVLAKVLMRDGRQWKMNRDQTWYWEWNFQSAKRKGTEREWFEQMPHTDVAAFQSSYENVFTKKVIAETWTDRANAYHAYSITGQSIEERHEADEEDEDTRFVRVPIKWASTRGEVFRWELVPVCWQEPFVELADLRQDETHMGNFFVYIPPEAGYDYSIGIKTSSGLDEEGTVITVARRARNSREQDIQVAEFRDSGVSHVEAFAWGAAITAFYSRYMNTDHGWNKPYRNPYIAIEQITSVGDTCQLQMRKLGFRRFHKMIRYDSRPQDMKKSKARKEGWYTYGWSAAMLTDTFVILAQNGWYKVNSAHTIWEMDHWEVHFTEAGKQKKEAGEDQTANGLYANALAAFCPNDLRSLADRTAKQYRGDLDVLKPPPLSFAETPSGLTIPLSPVVNVPALKIPLLDDRRRTL